jgi:hypothetical protein
VTASYVDSEENARCITDTFQLPLSLVVQMVHPVKSNNEKLTLVLNQPPLPLHSLFEDIAQSSPPEASMVRATAMLRNIQCKY